MHDIKHRSWGAFGDSVAGVGFCLIVFSIFLFIVPKLNVIICLLMLAAGVPLVIVGIVKNMGKYTGVILCLKIQNRKRRMRKIEKSLHVSILE